MSPTAVSFLIFDDDDDCLYLIRQGEGVTSSTTILHLRSSRRFGIYDRQGTLLFSTTSPFGRPRERWYISSLTWTFQLPLLGRSIKTSSTIILINVSSTMMISSIVDGFGSYYSLSPFGGHARESLVCSSPPSSTDFCYSESEYWLHANYPTNSLWFNIIDQTIVNRVVQSS